MNQKLKGKIMKIKRSEVIQLANKYIGNDSLEAQNQILFKIATARAARISYTTLGDNPKIDYEADIKLHDRLLLDKHLSCFEHCARAMSKEEYYSLVKGQVPTISDEDGILNLEYCAFSNGKINPFDKEDSSFFMGFKGINPNNGDRYGWCNNFKGFLSYRYLTENEKIN